VLGLNGAVRESENPLKNVCENANYGLKVLIIPWEIIWSWHALEKEFVLCS